MLELRTLVYEYLTRRDVDLVVETDAGAGRLLAKLRDWGEVADIEYVDGRARVGLRIAARFVDLIRREGGTIVSGAPEMPEEDPELLDAGEPFGAEDADAGEAEDA